MSEEDKYEGLSDEERAAIEEEEEGVTSQADTDDEDEDEGGDQETEAKAKDDDGEEESEEDEVKAKSDDGEEEDSADADARADDTPFSPYMEAEPPEDFDERMKALNEKREELDTQFSNNELDFADYQKADRAAEREMNELVRQKERAEFAASYNENLSKQRWQWEVDRFVSDVREKDGIDYEGDKDMRKRLDTAVRMVAQDPEAESWSGRRILQEADAWVRARVGKTAATPPKTSEADGEKKPAGKRKADLSVVPQTLANVPPADVGEVGERETKWDRLDKLAEKDSLLLEKELAKLSPEEQAAYLRSA